MFVLKAKKVKCDVTLAIDQGAMVGFNKNKKRNVIAAKNKSLIIAESSDFCLFWKDVLEPNLKETHGIVPVHTYDEMGFLHRFYKDHIRLFTVFEENEIVAGAVLYISKQVAHVQYMSANEKGKKSAALDFLMNDLINVKYAHKKIFDFGVVNDGQGINWGLTYWKESFGAQAYCQDTYEIDTNSSVYLKELIG